MRACDRAGVPLTFRSGGTSLSGQGLTDSVLVDTRMRFQDVEVLDDGRRVRVQPGATVRRVNALLAPYGRKLGPDPASESACTIGGVVANNSSGMHCGTRFNTYQTLESMVMVLPVRHRHRLLAAGCRPAAGAAGAGPARRAPPAAPTGPRRPGHRARPSGSSSR